MKKKINRETAKPRELEKLKKILRKCYLLKQPSAILQHVIYFLEWRDVINVQKTCEYFRRRYLENLDYKTVLYPAEDDMSQDDMPPLEGEERTIKANISRVDIKKYSTVLKIVNYSHIHTLQLGYIGERAVQTILDDLSAKQTHPKLSLDVYGYELDDKYVQMLKPHTLKTLYLKDFRPMYDSLKVLRTQNAGKDLSLLKSAQLEEFGGYFTQTTKSLLPLIHIPFLDITGSVKDIAVLGSPDSKVKKLNISGIDVTDVSMLGNLVELNISYTNVTDVSMLGRLQTLDISFTKVTDVSALGRLHTLNISSTGVTDLSALKNVHTLIFRGINPDTDISALNRVHTLDLSYSQIEDLCTLSKNPNMFRFIHTVNLSHTEIKNVERLKHVHTLDISTTNVTDVSALTHVRELNIENTAVKSFKGLKRAKKIAALSCSIENFSGIKNATVLKCSSGDAEKKTLKKMGWLLYIETDWTEAKSPCMWVR